MPLGFVPISLFWFLYMAGLGVIFPYQSLYFQENLGLSGTQLGIALAMHPLIGIIAAPIWGTWSDRTGKRKVCLLILAIGSAAGYFLVSSAEIFSTLLLFMCILAFFSAPAMSVATSLSFAILGKTQSHQFGHIRVWGTIGYLIMIVLFPIIFQMPGSEIEGSELGILKLIFPIAAFMCALSALVLFWIPTSKSISVRAKKGDFQKLLKLSPYLKLLGLAFLAFGLLAGPIVIFPVFVVAKGGDVETISRLWIPMLLLEVPLIYFAGSGLRRVGARGLIAFGISCDGLRWLITATASSLPIIFGIQLLHGAVVAGLIIGMQLFVENEVPDKIRVTGQALLGATMGLGAVISHLWFGFTLEHLGADMPYLITGTVAILLGLAAWFILDIKPRRRNHVDKSNKLE